MLRERIKKEIDWHEQVVSEIDAKPLWYRNSTAGRNLRNQCMYVIDILEKLLTEKI